MAEEQPPGTGEPSPDPDSDAAPDDAAADHAAANDAAPGDAAADNAAAHDAAADEAATVRRTLCRSSTDKVIAGVAGGIGAYFGIDAVIVRIAFIALTLLGGAGPFLYLIGWLAMPQEGSRSIVAEALGGDSPHRFRSLVAVGLIGLGLLITANLSGQLFDLFVGVWSIAPYLALILIAAGVALVLWPGPTGRHKPTPARPPAAHASPPGTPPTASAYATAAPTPPTAAGPEWSAVSPAGAPPPPGAPAAAARRRRRRTRVGSLTVAALLVYTGGAVLLGRLAGIDVDAATFFVIALAITGAGLVISAFARPARGLIAIGVLLLPGAVILAGADVSPWSGVGERREAPTRVAELQSEYKHGIGRLVLDLENLQPNGADRSVAVSLGVGELVVYVPDDIRLQANVDLGVGAVTTRRGRFNSREPAVSVRDSWGSIDSGFGVNSFVVSGETTGKPANRLNFDIDVGAGAVDILTVPSAAR